MKIQITVPCGHCDASIDFDYSEAVAELLNTVDCVICDQCQTFSDISEADIPSSIGD